MRVVAKAGARMPVSSARGAAKVQAVALAVRAAANLRAGPVVCPRAACLRISRAQAAEILPLRARVNHP